MSRNYKEDTCDECGKYKKEVYNRKLFNKKLCKYCYKIYKEHPFLYYPEIGIRAKDNEGRLICHLCGRAFENLSSHIHTKHNMSIEEYKKIHGLNKSKSLISENLKKEYKEKVYNQNLKGREHPGVKFGKGFDNRRQKQMSLEARKKMQGINRFRMNKENNT